MLRQKAILSMFGRSPIRPLQHHMEKAHAAVELLYPFMQAVFQKNWAQAKECQQRISHLEHEADDLKRDLRTHLPKSLFLPVPRSDLLGLLSQQEMLANTAKDIAGIVLGRKMIIPDAVAVAFDQFLKQCIHASAQATRAINELDELLETGFRGREVTVVETLIHELDKIESQTDHMQIEIRESLFVIEKTLAPVDVVFLYKIIELIGDLADYAQQTGNRLLLLLAS